jgi:hypothetical protein
VRLSLAGNLEKNHLYHAVYGTKRRERGYGPRSLSLRNKRARKIIKLGFLGFLNKILSHVFPTLMFALGNIKSKSVVSFIIVP